MADFLALFNLESMGCSLTLYEGLSTCFSKIKLARDTFCIPPESLMPGVEGIKNTQLHFVKHFTAASVLRTMHIEERYDAMSC
ncbi:hypothetical protein SUGI_0822150 [Cryptomeria japonica]|nr:hypothetical protein SUGI_0822150 [Cryptomeria japonica]